MKPWQILVFLLTTGLALCALSIFFPDDGINLFGKYKLTFYKIEQLYTDKKPMYADISAIIENSGIDEPEETIIESADSVIIEADSISLIIPEYAGADPDSLKKITHLIDFSATGKTLFNDFFKKLYKIQEERELVRILHYGDSQIETDRMTSFIRNRFQKKFGGAGCGLVPAVPLYKGKMSVKQDYSKKWNRFTGFGNIDTARTNKSFGALISYSAYDTKGIDSLENHWLEFKVSPIAYRTARNYNEISLYMSKKNRAYLNINVVVDDSTVERIEVADSINYNKLTWKFAKTPQSFRLEFTGEDSPELYGVSLDNHWGIAMDNIPLRGSAGLVFSKNDTLQLRQMYEDMNIGMVILQFGGNVVPYMKDAKTYKRIFKRELRVIKSLIPEAAVLVIGPSDMSLKENGVYQTYPNLEMIRDAMKEASIESGYAFWDMYEAMGGRNSMPSWVFAEPPLAISDFVHFNSKGAKIMAEMLYNAIIYEYNIWERQYISALQ